MNQKTPLSPKATEILDVAEQHMRRGGFSAVSFRDLASAVGVKSASVHYHFPQKADLGRALVRRYTARVMASLGDPFESNQSLTDGISRLVTCYRNALDEGDSVCLCAKLGAEIRHLPEEVAAEVALFFESVLNWSQQCFAVHVEKEQAVGLASYAVSTLQGAMVLAVATGDRTHFDQAVDMLLRQLESASS